LCKLFMIFGPMKRVPPISNIFIWVKPDFNGHLVLLNWWCEMPAVVVFPSQLCRCRFQRAVGRFGQEVDGLLFVAYQPPKPIPFAVRRCLPHVYEARALGDAGQLSCGVLRLEAPIGHVHISFDKAFHCHGVLPFLEFGSSLVVDGDSVNCYGF